MTLIVFLALQIGLPAHWAGVYQTRNCPVNGRVAFRPRLIQLSERVRRASKMPDPEEEVILGRIIGLIGCTMLVIAGLRLTNLQHVETTTLKGGEDRGGSQVKLTPREHYKRGKELYLRGKYFDALPHLEEASLSTTGLSASERRQNDDCLNRTRLKVQGVADQNDASDKPSVVRGQSDSWESDSPKNGNASNDDARDRVEQLMIQAKAAYKFGDKAEAAKLATLANKLAKSAKLKFAKDQMSPGEFLAKLTPVKLDASGKSNAAADSATDWANNDSVPASGVKQATSKGANRPDIRQTSTRNESDDFADSIASEENSPREEAGNRRMSTTKELAVKLIAQAREDIKAGRLDDAKRKALEADQLDATYDIIDDRPELLLADIDRRQNTTTIARNSGSKSSTSAAGKTKAGKDADRGLEQASASDNADSAKKQQALKLVEQARKAMEAGDLETAQAKAEQAERLNVVYKLFEDMPDVVLNEIAARRASQNIARKDSKVVPVRSAEEAPQAKALLSKARAALKEGRVDEAKELALKADEMKVAFGLFEDTPEIVLADIDRASNGAGRRSTNQSVTEEKGVDGLARQTEAIKMLRDARKLMKDGRFEEARAKALEVDAMEVALPVTADSPELLLTDLNKTINAQNIASRAGRQPSGSVNTANAVENHADNDNPFAARTGHRGNLVGASGTQVAENDDFPEIAQAGLSASELYTKGMAELKKGKRELAYQAFKAAFDSGERLDPVRTQRLNDYLRDLAPRANRSGIQMASEQAERLSDQTPMDAAQQEQLVKFERVRADVLNSVFKAERLKETDPQKALELIDQTMAKVENAELSTESAAPLMKQLNRTRSVLRTEIEQKAPNIALNEENKRVKDQIEKEIKAAVRIDQDMVKLVEEYNELYKQQRYAEAVIVAKKAKELNPKDPSVVVMVIKGQLALQNKFNEDLKSDKEETRLKVGNDIERGLVHDLSDDHPLSFDKKMWENVNKRKGKYGVDNRNKSEEEIQIEKNLQRKISLHEDNVPLVDVIRKIKAVADINIVFDEAGLEEEGVSSNTAISIDVDSITVKSALNLILQRFQLGYMVGDEVLKITNHVRQRGELINATYNVADLVVTIPNFGLDSSAASPRFGGVPGSSQGFANQAFLNNGLTGQAFAQVGPNANGFNIPGEHDSRLNGARRSTDFTELTNLITSTISPDTWEQAGGQARVQPFETTLSLVIRQTQKVHEEIADLLAQLRRLQDLQVTIEVRFITVADRFFERIGVDFNFDIKPTVGYPKVDNTLLPILPFGSTLVPQAGQNLFSQAGQQGQGGGGGQQGGGGGQQGQQGGQQGQQGQQGQSTSTGLFDAPPTKSLINNPASNTVVGLKSPTSFTPDLTIPFQQGSFDVGIPTFGGYNPTAGVQTGIAILSDLEAFFFISAAQGDSRTNLLFAPKVTTFNGIPATVSDTRRRPFVTGLVPTVGFAAVGYTPIISIIPEGITLTATPVVSADRRFVRLTLIPNFSSITDVFSYTATGTNAGAGGGQGGGGQQGGQGGFGGGQGGGGGGGQGGGGGGQFGIGGGLGSMQLMQTLFTQQGGFGGGGGGGGGGGQQGQGGGQQGQQGGQQGQGGGSAGGIAVQLPVVEVITVQTTVSVPDGGSVLLGGVKRLKEGRTMAGVPILNKIPYVSRLFRNSGVGRETESLMMMVTPRIIIQEEEEELLGIPRNN